MKRNMLKRKKGFTLIEVLSVIIIIGIIVLIAVPTVSDYLNSSRDTTYHTFEHSMEEAAKNRVISCITDNLNCPLPEDEEMQKLYLDTLIEEGYLDNMKDPDSNNFCEQLTSYVAIKGNQAGDYKYKACLYCGDYYTEDDECQKYEKDKDSDLPECGTISGESTRWTNENRTITIGCRDASSGCSQNIFSKTFSKTTPDGKGNIVIRDNSGNTKECEVNAFVDKTPPTCDVTEVRNEEYEYLEDVQWYSLKAKAELKNMADADSKLLTYGMGTSLANRDYNRQTEMELGKGITTVIGYVKDKAGNEGICATEFRVGTERPKFNLYYGYTIYPNNKDNYSLVNIEENGTNLKTTSSNPKITINNTSKYEDVEKLKITLVSTIQSKTEALLTYGNNKQKTATMQPGSNTVEFLIEKGTYDSYEIRLGTIDNITYKVSKFEVLTKDGSAWTNKDLTMYVEAVDAGMRTTEVSFEDGANGTWGTTFNKKFETKTHNWVITKNAINMKSDRAKGEFTVNIDKTKPTVTIKAEKTNGTAVATNTFANTGLNYTFTKGTTGESGYHIYYCKDTANTCTPNIEVTSGTKITTLNTATGIYYVRYTIVSNSGERGDVKSFTAKVDTKAPTCNDITGYATIVCSDTGNTSNGASGIVGWYLGKTNTTTGTYNTVTKTNSLNVDGTSKVTSAGT